MKHITFKSMTIAIALVASIAAFGDANMFKKIPFDTQTYSSSDPLGVEAIKGCVKTNHVGDVSVNGRLVQGDLESGAVVTGKFATAFGMGRAYGDYSLAEGAESNKGRDTVEDGDERVYPQAHGYGSHAEGSAVAKGFYAHAEGAGKQILTGSFADLPIVPTAEGDYSHAEGTHTWAKGPNSHAEGDTTLAAGRHCHSEGGENRTYSDYSHVEGKGNIITNSFAGRTDNTIGTGSHVEGHNNTLFSDSAGNHVEGVSHSVSRSGEGNHVEGISNTATGAGGAANHIEGKENTVSGTGNANHLEGWSNELLGSNYGNHLEGGKNKSWGKCSHVEGYGSEVNGEASHSEGSYTITSNNYEHAQGRYNVTHTGAGAYPKAGNTIHSIGIGNDGNRKNAVEVMQNGDIYIKGLGGYDGTSIANKTNLVDVLNKILKILQDNNLHENP